VTHRFTTTGVILLPKRVVSFYRNEWYTFTEISTTCWRMRVHNFCLFAVAGEWGFTISIYLLLLIFVYLLLLANEGSQFLFICCCWRLWIYNFCLFAVGGEWGYAISIYLMLVAN